MRVVHTIPDARAITTQARRSGQRIALVPTMGNLHRGHVSLMTIARESADVVVVSLFVNPTQFTVPADLASYPRTFAEDVATAESAGVDVLFAPEVSQMYQEDHRTTVTIRELGDRLEGQHRGPAHFQGVATIVAKLFNIVLPDVAYFGQKDAQQALVIRRMVEDLNFDVQVEVCPTVREPTGLAMSSRNSRLGAAARQRASVLSRALSEVERAIIAGERDSDRALAHGIRLLDGSDIAYDYFTAVDPTHLSPVRRLDGKVLIAVAASIEGVRLIDNLTVCISEAGVRPCGV